MTLRHETLCVCIAAVYYVMRWLVGKFGARYHVAPDNEDADSEDGVGKGRENGITVEMMSNRNRLYTP